VNVFIAPLAGPKVALLDAAKGRTFQPWSLVPPLSALIVGPFLWAANPKFEADSCLHSWASSNTFGELSENGYRSRNRRFLPIRRAIDGEDSRPEDRQSGANRPDLDGIVVRFAAVADIENLSSETATVNRPCARPEHCQAGAQRG
jgi:hypothetical protein